MKRLNSLYLLGFLLFSTSFTSFSQESPSSDNNYLVLYIETTDVVKIEALLQDLRACEGKVVTANFIQPNGELFVTYTDAMRDETIHQIVYRYFTDIKKVRGTNIVEYE